MGNFLGVLSILSLLSPASFAANELSYECLKGRLKISLAVPTGLAPWYMNVAWTEDPEKRQFGHVPAVVFNTLSNTTTIELDRARSSNALVSIFLGNLRFSHVDNSLVLENLKGLAGPTSTPCNSR